MVNCIPYNNKKFVQCHYAGCKGHRDLLIVILGLNDQIGDLSYAKLITFTILFIILTLYFSRNLLYAPLHSVYPYTGKKLFKEAKLLFFPPSTVTNQCSFIQESKMVFNRHEKLEGLPLT